MTSTRREFLSGWVRGLGLAVVAGTAWGGMVGRSESAPFALRPPGALPEEDFLATCIRCGQCVEACPYDILELGNELRDPAPGAPSFSARDNPCRMCPDVPCIPPCPTGSLVQDTPIEDARMGLAVLIDQENCIAFQGLRCEVCFRVCPLIDKAITLEYRPQQRTGRHAFFLPVVHSEFCTGCGMCEQACILEEPAIKVLPHDLAQGKLGEKYRIGWEDDAEISRDFDPDVPEAPVPDDIKQRQEEIIDSMNDLEGIVEP
jgi:ferredoxin-type protein NapG